MGDEKRKKRNVRIRKVSLWSKISSWPLDKLLAINEYFSTLDLDGIISDNNSYIFLLSVGINGTLILLLFVYSLLNGNGSSPYGNDSVFKDEFDFPHISGLPIGSNNLGLPYAKPPARKPHSYFSSKNREQLGKLASGVFLMDDSYEVHWGSIFSWFWSWSWKDLLFSLISTLILIISLLCIFNTVYVIKKRKRYAMYGRPPTTNNAPPTPSANIQFMNEPDSEFDDDESISGNSNDTGVFDSNNDNKNKNGNDSYSPFKLFGNLASQSLSPIKNLSTPIRNRFKNLQNSQNSFANPISDNSREVWNLDMWDPPEFNLCMLGGFSPLHLILIFTTKWFSFSSMKTLFFLSLLTVQNIICIRLFTIKLKDRALVFSEVFDEYNKKVVAPKLSACLQDASVGTDGSVTFSVPALERRYKKTSILPPRVPPSVSFSLNNPNSRSSSPFLKHSSGSLGGTSSGRNTPVGNRSFLWNNSNGFNSPSPSPLKRGSSYSSLKFENRNNFTRTARDF